MTNERLTVEQISILERDKSKLASNFFEFKSGTNQKEHATLSVPFNEVNDIKGLDIRLKRPNRSVPINSGVREEHTSRYSTIEWSRLIDASGSFDFWNDPKEDIYTEIDGEEI